MFSVLTNLSALEKASENVDETVGCLLFGNLLGLLLCLLSVDNLSNDSKKESKNLLAVTSCSLRL